MTNEDWRPVVRYEGLYEVSSLGRVRSLERTYLRHGFLISVRPRLMKLSIDPRRGSRSVTLRKNLKPARIYVHRLVCEAFHGPAPDGKPYVLHWDDNPANNFPENLRWGDKRDNAQDAIRNGVDANTRKTHCPQGHPYDSENTYYFPKGGRVCRMCRLEKQRRRALVTLDESDPKHGTLTGYTSYRCRCEACREVWSAYSRLRRSR